MSLRNALKAAVARCTPLPTQHATFAANDATGNATPVQHLPANPHGISAVCATAPATGVQPDADMDATRSNVANKLQVAPTSGSNVQPGALTTHRLTGDLLKAAMHRCDEYGDSEAARAEMRRQCLALTPLHQLDLLNHFRVPSLLTAESRDKNL